ncbi:MAG TPA: hypothetical protein VFE37_08340 [Chloroflexota bacterium]|nr:hypothetical protein [Chloroflexota bacterium]
MAMDRGPGGSALLPPAAPGAAPGAAERPAAPPAAAPDPSERAPMRHSATSTAARPQAGEASGEKRARPAAALAGLTPGAVAAWGLAATALALGLLLCALALVALASVTSLAVGPWRPLGDQLGSALERTGQVAAASGQAVRDAFDPAHPPRESLRQDTEFDALQVLGVGEPLGATDQSRVELVRIAKRPDARDAATAQYAVVQRALVVPQARRVLGVPLGEERGEQEHYLYQGQTFRLGSHYYKVNWVSVDRQQVAIARYRSADGVIGSLVFEYD